MSVAAAPPGLTDIYPVGCPITGALEAIPFHKGFQQINGMAVSSHPVFDILTHSTSKTEIMVPGKETLEETQKTSIPSAPLRTGLNQLDAYRLKLAQRASNRSSFMWHIGDRDLARASTGSSPPRQDNMASLL